MTLPGALRKAIETANEDDNVHVIVLSGNGRAFCSGYDLSIAGVY
jgi:enoyl-CoA hydratase